MKRCHYCHRQVSRFRTIDAGHGLRVVACLTCAARWDR